jgi:hypothetical protein
LKRARLTSKIKPPTSATRAFWLAAFSISEFFLKAVKDCLTTALLPPAYDILFLPKTRRI